MKKTTVGQIMLGLYYVFTVINVIQTSNVGWILGVIFVPMIVIPINLFMSLFVQFWATLVDVAWIAIAIYLMAE